MSANTGDESIFTKFKNLVLYKINNAISDPNAEKYAAEIAKNKEKKEKEEQFSPQINTTVDIITADTTKFNIKRLLNKILDQTIYFLKKVFFPFIALMLAMIVANEMIVYTAPVRIIFFIFTFLVCFFAPSLCTILALFYILKGAYSYYINNMTGKTPKEKMKIMPTIYTLLPITMYKPQSSLLKFFYYPFTYPKSDISAAELPKTMDKYWKELNESFKDLDQIVSSNPSIFSDQVEKLENKLLKKLHDPTQSNPIPAVALTEAPVTETPETEAPVTEAPVTETPETEAPVTETPEIEAPVTETPKAPILLKSSSPVKHNKIIAAVTPNTVTQSRI